MTANNLLNKWKLDLGGGAGSRALIKLAASDQTINPPGYHQGYIVTQQVETVSKNEQQQQHLLNKRAWDVALGPLKALPMNISFSKWLQSQVLTWGSMRLLIAST
uniref:ER membrane protein complex subunit 4 n=2 Tax=Meloidogyne enterolobii TaxID=390850 RepID=A0A6V7UVM9_MELEN|nr:unnamed protein product [Meloidogyne enterolobii]